MNAPLVNLTQPVLPPAIPDHFPKGVRPERTLRTREEFLQAARDLVPELRAHAKKTNDFRQPADESVEALIKAGLCGITRPRMYGGAELELSDQFDVGAILAEGCPSTAWDYIVWEVFNWIIGMMPKEGQDDVFGSGDVGLICGIFNPSGAKARVVDGGYMISGRWQFGSGSTHSSWGCVMGTIEGRTTPDGAPESRMMVVPRDQYEVLDTWYVRGLGGTGSHDIYIGEEIFVPEHRTMTRFDMNGDPPGAKLHNAASFRVPITPGAHLAAAATSVGAARGAIADFKEYASKRVIVNGVKQSDTASAAIRIATALMEVEAAQLLFQRMIRDIEDGIRAGRQMTTEMRAKTRNVSAHVPNACKQVVTSMVAGAGSGAMRESSFLSAYLLDVTTMSSHFSTQYDLGPENYGRVLLGLPPSNPAI